MKLIANRSNTGQPSATLAQHQTTTDSTPCVCWAAFYSCWSGIAYCWRRLQADADPMYVKCWASVAGAGHYLFITSQYFMRPVPACWRYWHDALNQIWVNVGSPSVTLAHIKRGAKHDTVTQYWANVNRTYRRGERTDTN